VVLTACGGGSSSSSSVATTTSAAASSSSAATGSSAGGSDSSAAQSLTATEADFSIKLDKDTLPAGAYSIRVDSTGNATHDLVVEQNGNKLAGSDKIGPGQSTTLDVNLEPGSYVFYCSVGNHRAMGMEINVTVQ